jgi:hypothetical protein
LKRITLILLLAVLSLSSLSTALIPSANAAPENVRVLSYSWYVYPDTAYGYGDFIVVGEVQNVGTTVLDHVVVRGIAYTADGPEADSLSTAYVENMLPGQKAPFYMDFTYQTAYGGNMTWATMVDHVDLAVVYANDTVVEPFMNLEIAATSYVNPMTNLFTVSGIVRNNGTEPSPNLVWAVTTFYDADGKVVAVNETASPFINTGLAPNATFSFTATARDYTQLTSQIASYSVIVQSRVVATPTPTPTVAPTLTPTVSPTFSPSPTQTPIVNPDSVAPELFYAIVGVLVVVVIVVALLFLRKSRK